MPRVKNVPNQKQRSDAVSGDPAKVNGLAPLVIKLISPETAKTEATRARDIWRGHADTAVKMKL